MDLILEYADYYALDALYPATLHRDDIYRQVASISGVTLVGGYLLYLLGAELAYEFLYEVNPRDGIAGTPVVPR